LQKIFIISKKAAQTNGMCSYYSFLSAYICDTQNGKLTKPKELAMKKYSCPKIDQFLGNETAGI